MSDVDTDQRCCRTGSSRRCMCLPYDDGFMITAQVLSIIAIVISWIWWVGFIISMIALVLHQIIWCCRQSRCGIIANQVVSIIAGLCCVFAGVFFLVARKKAYWCDPFTLSYWDNNDDNYRYDYCPEKAYAIVAFVDAALWFAAAACTIAFLKTGRYERWEAALSKTTNAETSPEAVEMGIVEAGAEVAEATPVEAELAQYVPPGIVESIAEPAEVIEKVDEV